MKQCLFIMLLLPAIFDGAVFAQTKTIYIQGKVSSFDNSLPLEGAGVIVKGTDNATGTQADGTFSLSLSAKDSVLVISLSGYNTEEVKVTASKDYEIFLKPAGSLTCLYGKHEYFVP